MTTDEIKSIIIRKAPEDPEFRRQLIADPRAAITSISGSGVPSDIQITVFDETPTSFCLALPPAQTSELSDADLASVSGGGGQKDQSNPANAFFQKLGDTIRWDLDPSSRNTGARPIW